MLEELDHLTRHSRVPRFLLLLVGALCLLAVLFGGTVLFLETVLTAEAVEERVNDKLGPATSGTYRVEVGAVDWSLWHRSLRTSEVRLQARSPSGLDAKVSTADSGETSYRGRFSSLQLTGVHLWPLVWRGELAVNEIHLREPTVHIIRGSGGETRREDDQTDGPSAIAKIQSALVDQLPAMWFGQLTIQEGTVVSAGRDSPPHAAVPTDSLWGVHVHAEEVRIDSSSQRDEHPVLLSERIRLSFEGYYHLSADSLYETSVGRLQASSSDSLLTVASLSVEPTVPDAVLMRRRGHQTNRLSASVGQTELTGIDYRQVLGTGSLLIRNAFLDSLRVDVYRNNQLPPPPSDPPPKMPHEIFQAVERTIQIDTIRVTNGTARYTKWTETSASPGSISFEQISATISNVTNDSRRMSSTSPSVIQARTKVAGAGWLETTIRVPLLSSHFAVSYEGTLGSIDAAAFNDAFVNIAGVRVEHGQVDSLWFSAGAEQGAAHGTVHGLYRNLSVETLDKETGDRGLRKRVGSFALDHFVVKASNTRDDRPLRTGTINHQYEEGDTFLKFLWHSLRSGLFSLLGL